MGNCNTCKANQKENQYQINSGLQPTQLTQRQDKAKSNEKIIVIEENIESTTLQKTGIKKRPKAALLLQSDSIEFHDNVIFQTEEINQSDIQQIKKTLKKHFVFSQLPDNEINIVISKMRSCIAHKNQYIFKQGDIAQSYYIILEGQCLIQINNQDKRVLKFGDSFGDLGIVYKAPRSASVKALTNCQLVQIGRKQFNKITQQINSIYQKQNLQFLKVLSFFQDLTQQQKNLVASTCLTEIYQEGQIIFNKGDDANSLYIVKKGKALIKEKDIEIKQKQSFGENCIVADGHAIRSNTIIAKTKINLISISRDILVNALGDNLKNVLKKNLIKKLIKQSSLYQQADQQLWNQTIQKVKFKSFKAQQIVIAKNSQYKDNIYISFGSSLQGINKTYQSNTIIEINLLKQNKQYIFDNDFKAIRDGQLYIINQINKNKLELSKIKKDNFQQKMIINDFYIVRQLRSGNFGQVFACYNINNKKIYAIKLLDRSIVQKQHMVQYLINQQQILRTAPKHCFLINFYKLLKDNNFIYFVMDYIDGQDLFDAMSKIAPFDDKKIKFYASQILLVLQHLHSHRIIYRDLKPQNLMVNNDGYLTLVDMGTAKKLKIQRRYRTRTIIGTPHYMAPEIILGKGYSFAVDLWSLGVLVYEFICGRLPFGQVSEDPFSIYEEIMSATLKYPRNCTKNSKIFIQRLLSRNPQHRMGNGYQELKKHSFFNGLDWNKILSKQIDPPYQPSIQNIISQSQITKALQSVKNRGGQAFVRYKKKKNKQNK